MIRKIISIKSVGRFDNYSASGDVELKRYNLIFAENGRGKTMLSAILRSLQTGNPAFVRGRTTLGTAHPAEVKILLTDGSIATLSNNTWSITVPNIAIFDSTFVDENVYSGDAVELDHKRKLYGVIVGKQGADMARQIDNLDTASRGKSTEIREARAAVQALTHGLMPETFLALPADPMIDDKITVKERELAAVKQVDPIKARAPLSTLVLPQLPVGVPALLAKTIEGVTEDAERRVTAQIKAHAMHSRGETWLSEGLRYRRGDACPFCGQRLEGVALIAAYKTYFSEAYNALRGEITTLRGRVDTVLSDRAIAGVEKILDQNTAAIEFWSGYCELAAPTIVGDGLGDKIRALRQSATTLLDRKGAAPLEPLAPDAAFLTAEASFADAQDAVAAYNARVAAANAVIAAKKAATGVADIKVVQRDLILLQATKARYESAGAAACASYEMALAQKDTIDREKAGIRKTLDEYATHVMRWYESTINRLLEEFHAGFRITGTTHSYAGGVVSSSYKILINETAVDLGDADTALDVPSFRNTLSAGDRSTLALVFFLAQLEHDPEKAGKIVILDDPYGSQDGFRKDCTIQKIRRCGAACSQVIVLSHDLDFLKRIWDRLEPDERKCLKLARIGQRNTTIIELDIEEATQAHYQAQRKVLLDYYHDGKGDPCDVVQKIRPVLETHCKLLGGGLLANGDTLGVMVGKIRAAGAGHQLHPVGDGLEELNEYTKHYMHGENPHAATEPIDDGALQGMVNKALVITGGC